MGEHSVLKTITGALVGELQEKLPNLQVMRTGAFRIVLFQSINYKYALVVADADGICLMRTKRSL